MSWLDKNYINLIAQSLDGFVWRSEQTANFRCPFCGDSQNNSLKKRGYFYLREGSWSMKCHNCQRSHKFSTFLKIQFPELHREYKLQNLRDNKDVISLFNQQVDEVEFKQPTTWEDLSTPASKLQEGHPALSYILSRKIPAKSIERVYYTESFSALVEEGFGVTKYRKDGKCILPDGEMIFFLITDDCGVIKGVQGRCISKKKFYTLLFQEGFPKIYGIGDNNPNKPTFVFEAAFCSLFVPNSLGLLGATTPSSLKEFVPQNKCVMVFDNEPRSKDTISRMETAIKQGLPIAFWPEGFQYKDLNDYMKDDEQQDLIGILKKLASNTYSGAKARMKLKQWQK